MPAGATKRKPPSERHHGESQNGYSQVSSWAPRHDNPPEGDLQPPTVDELEAELEPLKRGTHVWRAMRVRPDLYQIPISARLEVLIARSAVARSSVSSSQRCVAVGEVASGKSEGREQASDTRCIPERV